MKTKILSEEKVKEAAILLKKGCLVAIPTETVYGLAADINSVSAIHNIFKVKNRSRKTPLSIHISSLDQIYDFIEDFPANAKKLAEKFWPGPLTIILPKKNSVADLITANSDLVGIRFSSNETTLNVINLLGNPILATSANISKKPSPTCAQHVLDDLDGKINAVVKSKKTSLGFDSTVVCFKKNSLPVILRHGIIEKKEIESVVGKTHKNSFLTVCKNYFLNATFILVISDKKSYIEYVNKNKGNYFGALCYDEDRKDLEIFSVSYGKENDITSQYKSLFSSLRELDKHPEVKKIFVRFSSFLPKNAIYDKLNDISNEIIDLT